MAKLAELRAQLVEKRAELRELTDDLAVIRARIESEAVEQAGGEKKLGENAEARQRAFILALDADGDYGQFHVGLRLCEREIERLEAEIESARDERREWEWSIRLRLAAALDGKGIQVEEPAEMASDSEAFDAVADAEAIVQFEQQYEQDLAAAEEEHVAVAQGAPETYEEVDIPF